MAKGKDNKKDDNKKSDNKSAGVGKEFDASDYTKVLNVSKKNTKFAKKLSHKLNAWAKEQNKKDAAVTDPVVDQLIEQSDEMYADYGEDRSHFLDTFQPLEDEYLAGIDRFEGSIDEFGNKVSAFDAEVAKLKQEAEDYGSESNKQFMMGRAQASVADQFEAARKNSLSTLEKYGINPSATRYAALDMGVRTAQAAAQAAAGTNASLQVDDTSRAMFQTAMDRELQARGLDEAVLGWREKAQAMTGGMLEYGKSYADRAISESQLAGQQAAGASEVELAGSEQARRNKVSPAEFLNSTTSSINAWSSALNSGWNNQIGQMNAETEAAKAEAESSSGIGAIAGAALPLIGKLPFFAEEGGAVPKAYSPSLGKHPDDVKAQLTAGEFVIPKEVAAYIGTKKLQDIVRKANEEMGIPDTATA